MAEPTKTSGGAFQRQLAKKRGKLAPTPGSGSLVAPTVKTTHIMPTDDVHRLPGQNFLVLSYATPDGTTRVVSPKGLVMKFSGCCDTPEEADAHARNIRNEDPRFDVFVVDLYRWGQVPMPDDEKPFIRKEYTDEMLTRIIGGLQQSMEQGRKEMEDRKARDRAKAEAAMQKVKGKDYKMPEKSKLQIEYEEKIRKTREEEERKAVEEGRKTKIMHSEDEVLEILMSYCADRAGTVIDAGMGPDMVKYFIAKSVERLALKKKATDRERESDDPRNLPSREEVIEKLKEAEAAKNGDEALKM